jgi:hypothetical protein
VVIRARQARTMAAGPYQPVINSLRLHLNAEAKSPKTIRAYVESTQWFAAAHLLARGGTGAWAAVTADDIRTWMASVLERYEEELKSLSKSCNGKTFAD